MDQLLHDNGLQRKQIPIGQNSLFRAISDSLYFTTQYHQQISKSIVSYLKNKIASDLIPQSLLILKTNQTLMNDYCKQPTFHGFDMFNLQLTSMMYRVKINLYFVQDNKLMKRIFNDHYVKMIEISRDENNHYDSVWTKEFIQNATNIQQMLYQHLNKILDLQYEIPKTFKNIELDYWINDQNFTENRNLKKNRSNSVDKSKQQDQFQQELENIKKTQNDEESTIIQINNLKRNPPGLENNRVLTSVDTPNKKPQIIDVPEVRETGKLKFFDESKSYGFIVLDSDKSDVFVHLDDLQKAGITKEDLRKLGSCFRSQTQVNHYGRGNEKPPSFSFQLMTYLGKYNKSRKAVDLKLIE